jgi:hypothetical protein
MTNVARLGNMSGHHISPLPPHHDVLLPGSRETSRYCRFKVGNAIISVVNNSWSRRLPRQTSRMDARSDVGRGGGWDEPLSHPRPLSWVRVLDTKSRDLRSLYYCKLQYSVSREALVYPHPSQPRSPSQLNINRFAMKQRARPYTEQSKCL